MFDGPLDYMELIYYICYLLLVLRNLLDMKKRLFLVAILGMSMVTVVAKTPRVQIKRNHLNLKHTNLPI